MPPEGVQSHAQKGCRFGGGMKIGESHTARWPLVHDRVLLNEVKKQLLDTLLAAANPMPNQQKVIAWSR